jgi:thiol-disulfide isomerase/thioredoxin
MRAVRFSLLLALALSAGPASPSAAADDVSLVPKDQRTPVPRLVLSDIPGARRQLSQFKGKVVVVNFWATWCVPCKEEMPEFTRVYAAYRDRGVEFLGAANEPRSSRPKVQEFVKALEIGFPIWLEASEDNLKAFGLPAALPGTVIVDSQGRLAARIPGQTHGAQLRELLDRVLSEEPVPPQRTGGR